MDCSSDCDRVTTTNKVVRNKDGLILFDKQEECFVHAFRQSPKHDFFYKLGSYKFGSCVNQAAFVKQFMRMLPAQRQFYELIRGDRSCPLFFDVEIMLDHPCTEEDEKKILGAVDTCVKIVLNRSGLTETKETSSFFRYIYSTNHRASKGKFKASFHIPYPCLRCEDWKHHFADILREVHDVSMTMPILTYMKEEKKGTFLASAIDKGIASNNRAMRTLGSRKDADGQGLALPGGKKITDVDMYLHLLQSVDWENRPHLILPHITSSQRLAKQVTYKKPRKFHEDIKDEKEAPDCSVATETDHDEGVEYPYDYYDRDEAKDIIDHHIPAVDLKEPRPRAVWLKVGWALGHIFQGAEAGYNLWLQYSTDCKDPMQDYFVTLEDDKRERQLKMMLNYYESWKTCYSLGKGPPGVPLALDFLRAQPQTKRKLLPLDTDTWKKRIFGDIPTKTDMDRIRARLNEIYPLLDVPTNSNMCKNFIPRSAEEQKVLKDEIKSLEEKLGKSKVGTQCMIRALVDLNRRWVYVKSKKAQVGDITMESAYFPVPNSTMWEKRPCPTWIFRSQKSHQEMYADLTVPEYKIDYKYTFGVKKMKEIGVVNHSITAMWLKWDKRTTTSNIEFVPKEGSTPYHHNIFMGQNITEDDVDAWLFANELDDLKEEEIQQELQGRVKPFLDHLLNVICHGNAENAKFAIRLMAWMIVYPTIKSQVVWQVNGPPGCGKTEFFKIYLSGIAGHQYTVSIEKSDDLTKFSGPFLKQTMFLILDDCLKVMSREGAAQIKKIATQFKIMIEEKYGIQYFTDNFLNAIIINNDEFHSQLIEFGDRRYFTTHAVFSIPEGMTMKDYFDAAFGVPQIVVAAYYYKVVKPQIDREKWVPWQHVPKDEDLANQMLRSANGTLRGYAHRKLCLDREYFQTRYVQKGIGSDVLEKDFNRYRKDKNYEQHSFVQDIKKYLVVQKHKQKRCYGKGNTGAYHCGCSNRAVEILSDGQPTGRYQCIHQPHVLYLEDMDVCRAHFVGKMSHGSNKLEYVWPDEVYEDTILEIGQGQNIVVQMVQPSNDISWERPAKRHKK